MKKLEITIPTIPLPQARPRFGRGRAYEDSRSRQYKQIIAASAVAAMKGGEQMTGTLKVTARFCKNAKPSSRRFGDIDNLLKAVLDALNGTAYSDDAAVVEVAAAKIQSNEPKIELEIERIGD